MTYSPHIHLSSFISVRGKVQCLTIISGVFLVHSKGFCFNVCHQGSLLEHEQWLTEHLSTCLSFTSHFSEVQHKHYTSVTEGISSISIMLSSLRYLDCCVAEYYTVWCCHGQLGNIDHIQTALWGNKVSDLCLEQNCIGSIKVRGCQLSDYGLDANTSKHHKKNNCKRADRKSKLVKFSKVAL